MVSRVLTSLVLGFIFILTLQSSVLTQKLILKYCRVESSPPEEIGLVPCPRKAISETIELECNIGFDRADCMRRLVNYEVDFMVAQPEDLMVLALEDNMDVLITHQFKLDEKGYAKYKWVAIARNDIENIQQAQGKKYCAPDGDMTFHTQYYTKYFENKLITLKCDSQASLLDNRMATLSKNFESACINTPWTFDYDLDTKLKRKYNNLCHTCHVSSNCTIGKTSLDKEYTFPCLDYEKADIGWSTLKTARLHLKEAEILSKNFHYLCPDNTTRRISENPCIWIEEPRRTIVVSKDYIEPVRKFLIEQENAFTQVIHKDSTLRPNGELAPFKRLRTPKEYLKNLYPEFYNLKNNLQCNRNARKIIWCVTSRVEARKCRWLSYSAQSYGVEPLIDCVKKSNRKKCFESVRDNKSDIFSIKPSETSEAKNKRLKPIIHMISNKGHESQVVAFVRKVTHFNSPLELKNLIACFTGYRDAGWNTFIYRMRKLTRDKDWYLDDKRMVSEFFSEVCVIGLSKLNSTFPRNLYSFCDSIRDRENVNNVAACFAAGADIAFTEMSTNMIYKPGSLQQKTYFKPLCLNDSSNNVGRKKNCISTWSNVGSIVAHESISKVREEDIFLMLVELDKLFGMTYQGSTPLLSLYGLFAGEPNVIFASDTMYMERNICSAPCQLNYEQVLEKLSSNVTDDDSSDGKNSLKPKMYVVIAVTFICYLICY